MKTWPFMGILLLACTGSEVGNPPFEPEVPEVIYDLGAIDLTPDPAGTSSIILRIPEHTVPGIIRMTATELSSTSGPWPMRRIDGAFEISLQSMRQSRVVRIHARSNAEQTAPLDLLVLTDSEFIWVDPAAGCLEVESRDRSAPEGVRIRVRNRCRYGVEIDAMLRIGDWIAEPASRRAEPDQVVFFELVPGGLAEDDTLLLQQADEQVAITLRR